MYARVRRKPTAFTREWPVPYGCGAGLAKSAESHQLPRFLRVFREHFAGNVESRNYILERHRIRKHGRLISEAKHSGDSPSSSSRSGRTLSANFTKSIAALWEIDWLATTP